jgi:hypothetical protein
VLARSSVESGMAVGKCLMTCGERIGSLLGQVKAKDLKTLGRKVNLCKTEARNMHLYILLTASLFRAVACSPAPEVDIIHPVVLSERQVIDAPLSIATGWPTQSSTPAKFNAAATSAVAPVPTTIPTGWTYKGCYVDGPGYRIMGFQQADSSSQTVASCSSKCASLNYTIAGMEYSSQCFCDNFIRQNGSLASLDSQCSMACSGNSSQACGGPDRLSVWSSQTTLKVLKKPIAYPTVGNWTYQGCVADPPGVDAWNRTFPWQLINGTGNSPAWCLGQCAQYGYMTGGMEYGTECYCGDFKGATAMPETDCNTVSFPIPVLRKAEPPNLHKIRSPLF